MTKYSIFLTLINDAVAKFHLSMNTKEIFRPAPEFKIFDQVAIPSLNNPTVTTSINDSIIPTMRPMIRKKTTMDPKLRPELRDIALCSCYVLLFCFSILEELFSATSIIFILFNLKWI
jgi:hypothetical protein